MDFFYSISNITILIFNLSLLLFLFLIIKLRKRTLIKGLRYFTIILYSVVIVTLVTTLVNLLLIKTNNFNDKYIKYYYDFEKVELFSLDTCSFGIRYETILTYKNSDKLKCFMFCNYDEEFNMIGAYTFSLTNKFGDIEYNDPLSSSVEEKEKLFNKFIKPALEDDFNK